MNKKQLILGFVLAILILILACIQIPFKGNFERAVLRDNGISNFKKYNFNENNFIISLPDTWKVTNNQNNIIYFSDNENILNGCLQVFNNECSIEQFAKQDCRNQTLKYSNLDIMPYKDLNNQGVLSSYTTVINDGYDYQNKCYYLKMDDGKIVKVLFNIKNNFYKENIDKVFNYIIMSIKPN